MLPTSLSPQKMIPASAVPVKEIIENNVESEKTIRKVGIKSQFGIC